MTPTQIESRASDALAFLTDTDEKSADLKHDAARAEARYEATVDALFLTLEGTVEARKARARVDAEAMYVEFLEVQRKYDAMQNKRKSEMVVVEWLRSLYSAKKQGL